MSKHIIQSQPLVSAPEGGTQEYVQPCRWYWVSDGRWSARRADAHVFQGPSDAVSKIRDLRASIDAVEFTLEPVQGDTARWAFGTRRDPPP